ncbi:MAG: cbb3-type cytochrome c oxidase N-terminal domain-containing protein [Bacteroidota bacterium]
MKSRIYSLFLFLGFFLLSTGSLLGQEAEAPASSPNEEIVWFLLIAMLIIAVACLVLTVTIWVLLLKKKEPVAAEEVEVVAEVVEEKKVSIFSWEYIQRKLTDAVPVEKEADIDMGHDYDGIRELDNNLPPWWKIGFYISIAYAIIYMFMFHFSGNEWSSIQEYEEEMAAAELAKEAYLKTVANRVDESNVSRVVDAARIANGAGIYVAKCAVCHGQQGEGVIGPNLTDAYWLHGGDVKDVFKTIKYGVEAKGMIAWQNEIKPKDMQDLSSFILTMQGTNPPNQKAPEGEKHVPVEEVQADSAATANDLAIADL